MSDERAGQVRWFQARLDGGTEHLYEPRRDWRNAVKWEPLCGLYGTDDGLGRCATCMEMLVDETTMEA